MPEHSPYEVIDGELCISTDQSRLDFDLIHRRIAETYWAADMPRDLFERSVRNALCFGLFLNSECIGFARVITDHPTFAYLSDVLIEPEHRGRGYGPGS